MWQNITIAVLLIAGIALVVTCLRTKFGDWAFLGLIMAIGCSLILTGLVWVVIRLFYFASIGGMWR